ncbi:TdeIII family type II restriction endonuclease [Bacteroides sp.]|uniref:TdeIII family type II restriction endonuclease n=1 Tax=Bacteroides sp. TaxID=29523 RepID=UPI0025BC1F08|nr:TdeIII family type II restriction endonuclease [Bacteroides sp.]
MALTNIQKEQIQQVIANCLRNKFKNYVPKNNFMPFHFRLLGKDRLALYSFMQSLLTTFGSSIFEPVAVAVAKTKFLKVESQYVVGDSIYSDCQHAVQTIINGLTISAKPNKIKELEILRISLSGTINNLKPSRADLFVETTSGEQYLFDLKTAKPNIGAFQKHKQTLLEWAGITYTKDKNAQVHTLIAIPYNPYEPQPYQFWTLAGMLDLEKELKVAKDFWDFLGGDGVYEELLDCFEMAGIELRPEIDEYFANFNH